MRSFSLIGYAIFCFFVLVFTIDNFGLVYAILVAVVLILIMLIYITMKKSKKIDEELSQFDFPEQNQ